MYKDTHISPPAGCFKGQLRGGRDEDRRAYRNVPSLAWKTKYDRYQRHEEYRSAFRAHPFVHRAVEGGDQRSSQWHRGQIAHRARFLRRNETSAMAVQREKNHYRSRTA
jgi:hypothetical protein